MPTGAVLLAMLMFPLPWINLTCGRQVPGQPKEIMFHATQSGLQAVYGGVTIHEDSEAGDDVRSEDHVDDSNRGNHNSLLLAVYGMLMMAALIVGLSMQTGVNRARVQAAFSAVALLLMVIQAMVGLPLQLENTPQEPDPIYHQFLDVRHTFWFWLALASTIAAPILSLIQWKSLRQRPS